MEGGKGAATDDEGTSGGGGIEESLGVKLKRGVAVGKKGGLCTPVPTWKVGDTGPADGGAAEPKRSSVSARKLGANLWEIQDPVPAAAMNRRGARIRRHGDVNVLDECPEHLAADHDDRPESAGSLRRHLAGSLIKHYKLNDRNDRVLQSVSPASYSSSMEIAAISQAISPCSFVDLKGKLSEAGYGLRTSTELLKVLNRIWSMEEQHASYSSLVKSLKVELEQAQARIEELMQEQHVYRHEMDGLVKQFAEDKMIRKNKEQQKIKAAVQSIRDELEDERNLRRRSESLHRKLGKELSEVNAAYVKALKDLERERRTNSLLENLCDEFAKGITDYEREVRGLKQKFPSDSDHKVERLVLHISEAWLDERVQMNIAEAQGDLAEKTTVTDRLRSEIESFLQATRCSAFRNDSPHRKDEKKESNMRCQSLESVHLNGTTSAPHDADDEDDDDSVASDMHCFELNVSTCKHGSHDQIKQNKQKRISGEELGHSESKENCSELGRKYKGEKTKLCGIKIKLPDQAQGVHFRAGDERASEVDRIGTSRTQKSDCCHSQECVPEAKVKWARLRRSKHPTTNSVKKDSENSESFPLDHGKHCEESHNRLLWKSQFAAIDGDIDSGNMHQVSSPVQQWKYQHTPSNLPESSKSAHNVKDSTLKAKLLEASIEGKHTRLKTLKRPSMMVRTRHRE